MQNILILLDRYLPKPSVNGICCNNIIKELKSARYNVTVGTYRSRENSPCENIEGVKVYKVWENINNSTNISCWQKLRQYIKWIIPWLKHPAAENKKITASIVKTAKQIIDENNIDTVVGVHIPSETLIAGKELKLIYPNLKLYAYMLDPLYGGFSPRFLPAKYVDKKNKRWESNILSHYDVPILMESSRSIHEKNNMTDNWYKKAVYLDVPLFSQIKNNALPRKNNRNPGITKISFCGSLESPRRNVEYILKLIKAQNDMSVIYTFAGETNHPELFDNCPKNICYLGFVPHEKLCDILEDSDIFLNLGVCVPSAISGKIFEYMSYGKPIISTYSIDDEACIPYLQKYPAALLLDERLGIIDKQVEVLNQFIDKNRRILINMDYVRETFYKSTPQAFVDLLNNE